MTLRRTLGAVAVGLVLVAVTSCDPRVFFAQSDLFDGVRGDLLEQCCACLARRGTRAPGASCAEAVLGPDGGVVLPADAVVAPPDPDFTADDLDDVVDETQFGPDGGVEIAGEIPCSCGVDQASCVGLLGAGERITVPGACIDQPNNFFFDAPCEDACAGVLTFDAVPGGT